MNLISSGKIVNLGIWELVYQIRDRVLFVFNKTRLTNCFLIYIISKKSKKCIKGVTMGNEQDKFI